MADENKRSCMTCKYRDEIFAPPPSIERMSICRQGPPTAAILNGPQGVMQTAMFPPVGPGAWCYRWQLDDKATKVALLS